MRVNPYVYAGNTPTTYVDSDGRSFADALGKFGNAIDNGLDWLGDKASDAWKWITDTASSAWDAITGTFSAVACALKSSETQMAVKLLIGTLGLAIGIAATAQAIHGWYQTGSTTGGATLEIKVSNSKVYKIRY